MSFFKAKESARRAISTIDDDDEQGDGIDLSKNYSALSEADLHFLRSIAESRTDDDIVVLIERSPTRLDVLNVTPRNDPSGLAKRARAALVGALTRRFGDEKA